MDTQRLFVPVDFKFVGDEVVGYANAPVIDRGDAKHRDLIPSDTWLSALGEFFGGGAPINFMHRPMLVGKTKSLELTEEGPLLTTVPTKAWVADSIRAGDIKGYSIEYKLYDAELRPPVDGDPRPIREFRKFSLVRVSYVDEPMNQGSYFIGGMKVFLKDYRIKFDREAGVVTITAKDDASMNAISEYLADGIKTKSIPEDLAEVIGVKSEDFGEIKYDIRVEDGGGVKEMLEKFVKDIRDLLSSKGEKDETASPEGLKEVLDGFLASLKTIDIDEGKLDAIESQIAEIKESIPSGEKSLAEQLADLQEKAEDNSLVAAVEENSRAIKQITEVLDRMIAARKSIAPHGGGGDEVQAKEDFWGPDLG